METHLLGNSDLRERFRVDSKHRNVEKVLMRNGDADDKEGSVT